MKKTKGPLFKKRDESAVKSAKIENVFFFSCLFLHLPRCFYLLFNDTQVARGVPPCNWARRLLGLSPASHGTDLR